MTLGTCKDRSRSLCLLPSQQGWKWNSAKRASWGRPEHCLCHRRTSREDIPLPINGGADILVCPCLFVFFASPSLSLKIAVRNELEQSSVLVGDLLEQFFVRLASIHEGNGVDLDLLVLVEPADFGDDLVVVGEIAVGEDVDQLRLGR